MGAADEQLALQAVVTRMFVCTDRRDWQGVRAVLADEVYLDYTSLNGGEPAMLPADDLVAAWAGALGGLTSTQHLLGNFLVESLAGDEATVTCYGQATHSLPQQSGASLWTLGAYYVVGLRRTGEDWRIARLTMTVAWGDGNPQLLDRAQGR
ncbi:MAG TPA: nuclear transport factor 2 family protein [Gaiellaceae bacterium]|jgi:hypothetical protein